MLLANSGSLLLVVEFCAGGNLLHYLRKKRTSTDPLLPTDQLHMALDIAQGMEHLALNKVNSSSWFIYPY